MLAEEGARFDLVFLDPPYKLPEAPEMLVALRDSGLVEETALVVYEHARDDSPVLDGWNVRDRRDYGDTAISFLSLADGGEA